VTHSGNRTLDGRVAIVTGAGRGIGRAIAEQFAHEGAHVLVASRTRSTVDEVVQAIQSSGGSALGAVVDVGEKDQIGAMVERAVEGFGGVDILVNNAQSFGTRENPAVSSPQTTVEDVSEAEWDWTFESGVRATLRAMQAAFPYLKASGDGRVINFGSRRGVMCNPDSVAYNANKEAVRALSRTAANAWGQYGICVNVINPVIETDSARAVWADAPERRDLVEQMIPLRRWGQPLDCARVAVFLAGPDSSYLTGMTLMVEGGLTSLP
jgi:NAD(P)-dependent dehydrogenase (short-subunit alcohol dehydrogenase family)